jgi:sortase A
LPNRLTFQDGLIVAGVLLLFGSIVGLYADTIAANGAEDDSALPVVALVNPTRPAPPGQATATPFLPQPTAGAAAAFLVPLSGSEQPASTEELPVVEITLEADEPRPVIVTATPEHPPTPLPMVPNRIVISRLGVDAPVYAASYALVDFGGQVYQQWQAPTEYAVGWQFTSASLGAPGNTVLNGHHNVYGSVFARLSELVEGDVIEVYSGSVGVAYQVSNSMLLAEEGQPLSVRLENASWLAASTDERLTLVTCWPQWSNSHRVIIVARPVVYISTQ